MKYFNTFVKNGGKKRNVLGALSGLIAVVKVIGKGTKKEKRSN